MSGQIVEDNTTRATARLPGLNIEIIHRRSLNDEAEQISINLQAMPSFEAFGRFLAHLMHAKHELKANFCKTRSSVSARVSSAD